jgi:hypothetical protein
MTEEENINYKKMVDFYNELKSLHKLVSESAVAEKTDHPYAKFGDKSNPVFRSHLRDAERLESPKKIPSL